MLQSKYLEGIHDLILRRNHDRLRRRRTDLSAVALAQAGKKVLVLEQHDRPGGWTHSFTLSGYRFSPGVYYIGDLHEGGHLRNIYDGLGVSQDLTRLLKKDIELFPTIW